MTDDYIKKEDAIQSVINHDLLKSDWSRDWAEYLLEDAKPADVAPVRHGRWVFAGDNMFECLRCGVVYTLQQLDGLRNYDTDHCFPNYCPRCGAKMDGGDGSGR